MASEMTKLDPKQAEQIERAARAAEQDAVEQACMHVLAFEYPEASDAEVEGMFGAEMGAPGPGQPSAVELLLQLINGCADSKGAAIAALLVLLKAVQS